MALAGYPPERHVLADLGLHTAVLTETTARVWLEATPQVAAADGGVRAGVLAILVDLVGGVVAVRALHPDWMATADLTLQMLRPATGPFVEARGAVVRRGRTTLVVEAGVFNVAEPSAADDRGPVTDDSVDGAPVAWATMTFAVLPDRNTGPTADLPALPRRWGFAGGGFDGTIVDALAMSVIDATRGRVSMPARPYGLNSFGAVQGGVMALVAELAAIDSLGAASAAGPEGTVVTDLQVTYLALGRTGPIVSSATVLDAGGALGGSAVVELHDSGADDRLTTVVNVGTASVPAASVPSASAVVS